MDAPSDPLEAGLALAQAFEAAGISADPSHLARESDLVDLERLVEVQGPALDVAYVRKELAAMMGEDDARVRRWDELTASPS